MICVRWLLWIILILNYTYSCYGFEEEENDAVIDRGLTGAQFLKIGLSPRASALGGAYCALSDDAAAVYWNPAGLVQINGYELAVMHNRWLSSINCGFMSYVHSPENNIAYACSIRRVDIENMIETRIKDDGSYEETGNMFTAQDMMLSASYAKLYTKSFSVGTNLKLIRQRIQSYNAFSVAADFGMLYQLGALKLGVCVQNIGTGLRFIDTFARLPVGYRFGIMIKGNIKGKKTIGIVETATWLKEGTTVSFGMETYLNHWLICRIGYSYSRDIDERLYIQNNDILRGFTFGFGLISSPGYMFDYAFVPKGDFGFTHRVALKMRFVPKLVKEVIPPEEEMPKEEEVVKVPPERLEEVPEVKVVKKPEEVVEEVKPVKKLLEEKYIGIILSDDVTLWSGPGITYPVIKTLSKGTKVRVLDDSKKWYYKVQLEDGTIGWVSYVFIGKQ